MRAESDRRLLIALVCVVAAVYWPATQGPFQFDDYNVIVNNASVHDLHAWLASMPGIRPLLKLSYTLNWSASPAPLGFHLANIFIHLANTAIVYSLLRKLSSRHAHSMLIAFAGAAIFALHPAQTEAIAYICGRSVALMSFFYLLSLRCGIAATNATPFFSPLFFLYALLVKETAWTLPFALLLIEGWRGRKWRDAAISLWPHWTMLLLGALSLLAIADYRALLQHSLAIRSVGENMLLQISGVFYLLTQPLLLLRINIDPTITATTPQLLAQFFVLAALLIFGLWQLRSGHRDIGFAILWFFLHLLPTNSLLPRNDIANDRQLYLALIGPALWLGSILFAQTRIGFPAITALVLLLIFATHARIADYRSEVALWEATARDSPDKSRVWNNLGYAYQQAGAVDAARAAYQQALALDPAAVRARINLHLLDDSRQTQTSDGSPAGK